MRKCLCMLVLLAATASAQDLASFEKRVHVRRLANGLTVIVMERPEAPVFAFYTHVNTGGAQEQVGQTGLAHMFEHQAFKGTDKIGTRDWQAEKAALEQVEKAYAAYDRERRREVGRNENLIAELKKKWEAAMAEADQYVIPNEFDDILGRAGAVGVNASTNQDETDYYYSMPANQLELWAYLESERFLKPAVGREFYKERDVVMEERRMRTENQPIGKMVEQFLATAFMAHPYHRPTVGYASDLRSFSASDAVEFYKRYYVPSNMIVAVVGDVKAEQAFPIVEKYFGRLPSAPHPEPLSTIEPPQNAERRVTLREMSQPFYLEGYHRPGVQDPEDAVYDAISDLLSNGRTSRLYRSMVRDQKIAVQVSGFSGFPGQKYPHLFSFFAVPARGHSNTEMEKAIQAEIERLKNEDVSDEELQMVKTRAKANLIRSLDDNEGLASNLAWYQARYGDWRELFRNVDRIEKVTKADVRRVANKIFTPENRTVAMIETEAPAKAAAQPAGKAVQQ